MIESIVRQRVFSSFVILITLGLAGCEPALPPSKPLASLTPAEQAGRAVYLSNCARCHTITKSALHGPGLFGMFRRPYLPSGAPANDERVTAVVAHGRNMMPAFGNVLDQQQLDNLLAYLHTL